MGHIPSLLPQSKTGERGQKKYANGDRVIVGLSWGLLWRSIVVLTPVGIAISGLMSLWPWGGIGADLELLKPTIVFVTYAVIFIIIDSLLQASPLQLVFGWRLQLSIQEWRELSFGMSALMSVIAAINFLVASISTTLWVHFKLYGIPFVLSSGIVVLAHRIQKARFRAAIAGQLEARMANRT